MFFMWINVFTVFWSLFQYRFKQFTKCLLAQIHYFEFVMFKKIGLQKTLYIIYVDWDAYLAFIMDFHQIQQNLYAL